MEALIRMSRKQLHVWVSQADHEFLLQRAKECDEPLSTVVRRLIRLQRVAANRDNVTNAQNRERHTVKAVD
jgi:hypothetical protein